MKAQSISKEVAIDVIKDTLTINDVYHAGIVVGLCTAFHLAGLLTKEEMELYAGLIPGRTGSEKYLH